MPSTRSEDGKLTDSNESAAAGEKHGIEHEENSPDAKRTKTSNGEEDGLKQTTLDETFNKSGEQDKEKKEGQDETQNGKEEHVKDEEKHAENGQADDQKQSSQNQDDKTADTTDTNGKASNGTNNDPSQTAEKPHADPDVPSNILEKGIIYFFFRPRVNTPHPEDVNDVARSYLVLRPLASDAKLGAGPIGDAGNSRLLALPKKVLPQSGSDRFMLFVEKSGASFQELKDGFLAGDENQTKTQGTSVTEQAVPASEGVYIITSTGRETHLAYITTLPKGGLGEVQHELGVKERGSFILSTKNPEQKGPANASLPEKPDWPQSIQDEFRKLRWMPTKPEHLDYPNAQLLFIGESDGIEHAVEPREKDEKQGKEKPQDVLEEFEDEDVKRMKGLGGTDSEAIFKDLEASAKDYPGLKTTF